MIALKIKRKLFVMVASIILIMFLAGGFILHSNNQAIAEIEAMHEVYEIETRYYQVVNTFYQIGLIKNDSITRGYTGLHAIRLEELLEQVKVDIETLIPVLLKLSDERSYEGDMNAHLQNFGLAHEQYHELYVDQFEEYQGFQDIQEISLLINNVQRDVRITQNHMEEFFSEIGKESRESVTHTLSTSSTSIIVIISIMAVLSLLSVFLFGKILNKRVRVISDRILKEASMSKKPHDPFET